MAVTLAVRHSVLSNLNPSDLESAFYKAARDLRTEHEAKASDAKVLHGVKNTLAKVNPDDGSVVKSVEKTYLTKSQARYLLSSVANYMQSTTSEIGIDDGTLEHIFPEKPAAGWTNADELLDHVWHIGNLTLLGGKLNEKAANAPFRREGKAIRQVRDSDDPQDRSNV
jgi:hypothetical protein